MSNMHARLVDEGRTLDQEIAAINAAANLGDRDFNDDERERLDAITSRKGVIAGDLGRLDAIREEIRTAEPETPTTLTASNSHPSPFASLGDQLKAVVQATTNPYSQPDPGLLQIQAATGASELVGADGGFLVQHDIANDLINAVVTAAVLAPLATTREVGAGFNGVKFNMINETSRATGSRYGGVRAYWTAEGATKTASKPTYRQVDLGLEKLAGVYVTTDELLQDTTALESFVRPAFISEFAFAVDDAMYRGTGSGMPLGVLNSSALVTVSKETGQAAATILYENLVAMFARLSPGSVRNARWFTNQGLYSLFPLMSFTIGTGGVPVFLPPGGVTDAPFGTLLGLPIEVIEQASAPGTIGDILLADWKQYLLLRKGGIVQDSSIHVYFLSDETAFRWVLRINGRPMLESALTPYKGSATTSPFVTLNTRA